MVWLCVVAGFDTYMTVKSQEYLVHFELNPLARILLEWDGGGVALLIGAKLALFGIVTMICTRMIESGSKYTKTVLVTLAVIHIYVLFHYWPYWFIS